MRDEVASLREKGLSADTKLLLHLDNRNPDEGVTSIAYNKGYYFLRSIEEKHGREKFDSFVKDYFKENAFGSMNTEAFEKYISEYYQSKFDITLDKSAFNQWIHTEGLPSNVPEPDSKRFEKVDQVLASRQAEKRLDKSISQNWSTHEWLHFFKNLPDNLSTEQMAELDRFGNFTASGNSEIITAWGVISIHNQYKPMQPKIEDFLINTGRRKFLSPLYNELIKTEDGKNRARQIYKKARPNYHFVATNTFDKLLETR